MIFCVRVSEKPLFSAALKYVDELQSNSLGSVKVTAELFAPTEISAKGPVMFALGT
jgi:hypothetical protein